MPGYETSLGISECFIGIAQDISRSSALAQPLYLTIAHDMHKICKKFLVSSENMSGRLSSFVYIIFARQQVQEAGNIKVSRNIVQRAF